MRLVVIVNMTRCYYLLLRHGLLKSILSKKNKAMKQITLPSGEYLLVEVPRWATFNLLQSNHGSLLQVWDRDYQDLKMNESQLPSGNWQIIGKADSLSEDDWKGIVETKHGGFAGHLKGFKDYSPKYIYVDKDPISTAKESGHSLIESHQMKPETTLILKQKA